MNAGATTNTPTGNGRLLTSEKMRKAAEILEDSETKRLPDIRSVRAVEQLRQECEVFEQKKRQDARWFNLRLVMGYSSVAFLLLLIGVVILVMLNHASFPRSIVASAGAALFVDVFGMLLGVWKIVLNPNFIAQLTPDTTTSPQR